MLSLPVTATIKETCQSKRKKKSCGSQNVVEMQKGVTERIVKEKRSVTSVIYSNFLS